MGRKAKTFRQNGVRLNRCPCGADQMGWIPGTPTKDGTKMYHAICEGCGDIITGMSSSSGQGVWHYKDAWNRHMAKRQEQAAGQIIEKDQEEENQ